MRPWLCNTLRVPQDRVHPPCNFLMKPACRKSSSIGQHKWRTVPSGTSPHRGDFRAFPTVYVQYTTFVCTTTYQTEFVRVECRRHAKKSSIRATQTGTICLLSEEKATEVPTLALFVRVEHPFFIYIHLALFASSHRGESRFAENHNPTSLEIIPSRRFPFRLWVRRRRRRILRCVEQFIEFF